MNATATSAGVGSLEPKEQLTGRPTSGARRFRPAVRHVYFIEAETLGLIKIGFSDHVRSRMRDLQTMSPDRLRVLWFIPSTDAPSLEREMHERFAHLRSHGEWFKPGGDLLDFLSGLRAAVAAAEAAERDRVELLEAAEGDALNAEIA